MVVLGNLPRAFEIDDVWAGISICFATRRAKSFQNRSRLQFGWFAKRMMGGTNGGSMFKDVNLVAC